MHDIVHTCQKYINELQVLKETLRMYSPVIGLVKEVASGGVTLSDYHVPAQTQLIVRD